MKRKIFFRGIILIGTMTFLAFLAFCIRTWQDSFVTERFATIDHQFKNLSYLIRDIGILPDDIYSPLGEQLLSWRVSLFLSHPEDFGYMFEKLDGAHENFIEALDAIDSSKAWNDQSNLHALDYRPDRRTRR